MSKFGQRVVAMMILVAMVLVATVYLVVHRQAGESAGGIITAGFALAGSLGMGVLTWGQGRRLEELQYQQNEKLEQIHGEARVKDENTAAVIRETYQAALDVLVKEHQRERHQEKGKNGVLVAAVNQLEGENKGLREQKAALETQLHDLTEKLGRVAEKGAAKPGDANC